MKNNSKFFKGLYKLLSFLRYFSRFLLIFYFQPVKYTRILEANLKKAFSQCWNNLSVLFEFLGSMMQVRVDLLDIHIIYISNSKLIFQMSMGDHSFIPKIDSSSLSYPYSANLHFTPLNPFAGSLFCPRFKWEGLPSFPTLIKSKQQQLPSRLHIIEWQFHSMDNEQKRPLVEQLSATVFLLIVLAYFLLRFSNLSREEFSSATLIDNSEFIENFLKIFPKRSSKIWHLPSLRSYSPQFAISSAVQFDIYSFVRVALTPEYQIYFQGGQFGPRQLINGLDIVSKGKVFELPHKSLNRENIQQNLLWFNSSTFHSLEEWLASELQKVILNYYFHPKDRISKISSLKKHMTEKKASKQLFNALTINLSQISQGFFLEKGKISDSIKVYEESMRDRLQQQMLNVVDDKKKKKRRKNKKDKKEQDEQYTNQPLKNINEIEKYVQGKDITEEKDVLQNMKTAEDLMCSGEQTEINNESECVDNLEFVGEDSMSTQIIEIDCGQSIHKSMNATNISHTIQNCGIAFSEEQFFEEAAHSEEIKLDGCFENVKIKRNSSHDHIGSSKYIQSQQINEEEQEKNSSDAQTVINGQSSDMKCRKKKKRKGQKTQNKIIEDFKAKITSIIMNKQLNQMLDNLSMQSNSSYDSKVTAFERVRYFVKSIYPYGESVLFGSNAVGLSLPTSDIDIMLIDMPCRSKQDICDCLAQIAIFINAMGWVISCSTYFNAKVPLVKLQIDPSVSYYTPKRKSDYFQVIDPYISCYLDLKDPSKGVPIKVDITISTEDGKVSGSTELMRNCLQGNSSLQRVLLALKYSLSVRGFSENFKGGIGSYCLFVMVAAYFRQFKEAREGEDCQILLDILKYYGEDFENQLKVITLSEQDQKCFILNDQARQSFELSDQILFNNLLKIIDPLNSKLMSSSCFQFNNIKSEWRQIREDILELEELVQTQIESCFANTSEISKLLGNKKSLDKWANKLQSRIDYSISRIIQGNSC